jgi:CheY-like chemotaxis protein/two-component sensor histidine kinase
MKDEFLATVSHELRTPLNAIIGWSHMLRSGRLDQATVQRAVETIERNAKSQAQLVEDILDVSRVITGQLRLSTAPVDLSAVVNSSIDSVQLAAESKEIQLEVILSPAARHTVGDAARLQQVVWNLLSNAIKFTPAGGRVEVRLERAGANVEIKVSDCGQGISADFLPFIFDRFRQADGTSTRRHGGLGLGLAIVRHLVELHGGTVRAESAGDGLGSTFTVSLPLAVNPQQTRVRRKGVRMHDVPEVEAETPPSLENVCVLLVEPDPDTLQVLTLALQSYKADVQPVGSVAAAMEVMEWYKPDVVISDLTMPDEDGYSLIEKIRGLEAGSENRVPAVALTSYVRVEERTRTLAAGFNMFVPKPVQPGELVAAVSHLLELPVASL